MYRNGSAAVDFHAASAQGTGEKRSSPRRKTLKEGRVVLSDWSTIDCTIRDLSEGGARLVFGGPTTLPAAFWVLIPSSDKLVPAETVWQRGLAAGVRFTGPERHAPPRKWKST